MRIALIASEAEPFAKTGGLADVAGALSRVLARRGHDVALFVPRYLGVESKAGKVIQLARDLPVAVGDGTERLEVTKASHEGVTVYFVGHDEFFRRPELYRDPATDSDWKDNDRRFVFFGKAVLEICKLRNWYPDVVHANDWQSGPLLALLGTHFREAPEWQHTRSLFTVHNIAYQGIFPEKSFGLFSLGPEWWYPGGPFEYWGKTNFLKLGLEFGDALSTVSPRYAREISESAEYGFGMEGILERRSAHLSGIANGIDYDLWNPATDPLIPAHFTALDLSGKATCKSRLQAEMGLPESKAALVGIISRLADQKGFDLIEQAASDLLSRPLQMVVLGTGDKKYHTLLETLQERFPDRLRVKLGFDNGLAHRIEAGCDMFLMPSRYEPCGLNQMYSQRYGTIPVVRATGGLADTVIPYTPRTGTGFQFEAYDARAMMSAVDSALGVFGHPERWRPLVLRAMAADFSWNAAAQAYEHLYGAIMTRPRLSVSRHAVR